MRLVLLMGVGLVLLSPPRGGEARRVQLNSIRTLVLREEGGPGGPVGPGGPGGPAAVPAHRSPWEPDLDLTGRYCHTPPGGPAHYCRSCRRRSRRCRGDGMCCPGNRCHRGKCVADPGAIQDPDQDQNPLTRRRGGWGLPGPHPGRGQVGDPCLRSSDCSAGFCCARHFWTRICKPVLREGQVCTRQRRKGGRGGPGGPGGGQGGLELFQRCSCGGGLGCRPAPPSSSSSSSSSSLLAAARSKFSSPRDSMLPSSSATVKTRLHVCQKL
ncbi:dickkopf-related protein 2-like [Cololabis saira]|uniref:dickkopf-related protein 2-like n=1 Tax=Cololabis saira TaxID=129043 RepID=UPI002AD5340E|nr:dickkopf-related protein 2-like [Cololabis saira]